jgi:hypothetical protein
MKASLNSINDDSGMRGQASLKSQVRFGVIADEPLRVFQIERFLIQPYSDAASFGLANDLVGANIISRELPELIEDVARNQVLDLCEGDYHCLPPRIDSS